MQLQVDKTEDTLYLYNFPHCGVKWLHASVAAVVEVQDEEELAFLRPNHLKNQSTHATVRRALQLQG